MTGDEWLTVREPLRLLTILRGRVSNRKLRLFGCACCRRLGEWMAEAGQLKRIETAEAHADGQATADDWLLAFRNPDFSRPFVITYRHLTIAAAYCLGWQDAEDPD